MWVRKRAEWPAGMAWWTRFVAITVLPRPRGATPSTFSRCARNSSVRTLRRSGDGSLRTPLEAPELRVPKAGCKHGGKTVQAIWEIHPVLTLKWAQ
jgi:hypothetical protein